MCFRKKTRGTSRTEQSTGKTSLANNQPAGQTGSLFTSVRPRSLTGPPSASIWKLLASATLSLVVTAQPQPIVGWHPSGSNGKEYEFSLDHEVVHGGHASATIRCPKKRCSGFATLEQWIQADAFLGRRLRLTAWVKSTASGPVRIWMRVDGNQAELLAFDNMDNRAKRGAFDWTQQQVVLDVIGPAAVIHFGVMLPGRGQAWIDDVELKVVGPEVGSTNMLSGLLPSTRSPKAVWETYRTASPEPVNLDFEQ